MEEAATAQRVAGERALRAAELVRFETDANTYRRYAAEAAEGQSQDQIDAVVASGMLKEDYSSDQVAAVLSTSPDLVHRHTDADGYVNALVQRAQESLGIEVANVKGLLRRKAKG